MVLIVLLLLVASIGFLLFALIHRLKMPKEQVEQIRAEHQKNIAESKATMAAAKAERERLRKQKQRDKTPVSAKLLYVQSEHGKRAMGTAARGLIGAAVAGTFGAAVGIASGRAQERAKSATFAVKYASGRKGNETVDVHSERFKELSALLVD